MKHFHPAEPIRARRSPEWSCRALRRSRRLNARAQRLYRRGHAQDAARLATQACELLRADRHPHALDTVAVRLSLASALIALGNYPRATEVLEYAVALPITTTAGEAQMVDSLTLLGNVNRLRGHYTEAEVQLRRATELATHLPQGHTARATAANAFGILCKDTGRYAEAEALYQQALDADPDPPLRASLLHNLAGLAHAQGDYVTAEPAARAAVQIRAVQLGEKHPDVAADRAVLAAVLLGQHRYVEAESLFRQALATFTAHYGPDHYEVAVNCGNLASVYTETDRWDDAERFYLRAMQIKEHLLGRRHPEIGTLKNNLAVLYARQGRDDEARASYHDAMSILDESLGPDHPSARDCRTNYLKACSGNADEAHPPLPVTDHRRPDQ